MPWDIFAARQRQGLAALIRLSTLQLLAATPLAFLGDDTEELTVESILRAA